MSEQPILLKSVLIFTNPKGQHNSSLAYQKMDEVQHQTSIYVAAEDIPAGVAITDARWVKKLDNSAAYQAEQERQTAEGEREQAETAREVAEGLREQGETARNTAYIEAEGVRDGRYETAEGARDGLFTGSQQDRTSAYNLRENQRDDAYDAAELARGGLYEAAESARDGLYENAEAGRGQAFEVAEIERNQTLAEGIEAGRLNYKGPYNPSTLYSFNNWVTDSGFSYAYINPTPSTGTALSDTNYWVCFAEKGDKGDKGDQGIQGIQGDPGDVSTAQMKIGNPAIINPVGESNLFIKAELVSTQEGEGDPSPDNVRAIVPSVRAGETVRGKRTGKNLLAHNDAGAYEHNGIKVTPNSDGSITITGTSTTTTYYNFISNSYQKGYYYKNIFGDGMTVYSGEDVDYKPQTRTRADGQKVTFAPGLALNSGGSIYYTIRAGVTYNETRYPQIEYGDSATPYEPYSGDAYDLYTADQDLYGLPDAPVVVDTKAGTVTAQDGVYKFTGSETVGGGVELSSDLYRFVFVGVLPEDLASDAYVVNDSNGACSHFKYLEQYTGTTFGERAYVNLRNVYLIVHPSIASTSEEMTAFLTAQHAAGAPVTIQFPLATPITIPITPPDILALPRNTRNDPRINVVSVNVNGIMAGIKKHSVIYGESLITENNLESNLEATRSLAMMKYTHIPQIRFYGDTADMTKDVGVVLRYEYNGAKNYINSPTDAGMRENGVRYGGYAEVKWQGTSSIAFPKKNYTVKFYVDAMKVDKQKLTLRTAWGAQYKYCMKANFIDPTQCRNVVAAKLWGDCVRSRDATSESYVRMNALPNAGAVDGYPVLTFINNQYVGLYTMNIPKDEWTFGMKDGEGTNVVLCGESWVEAAIFYGPALIDGSDWDYEVEPADKSGVAASFNRIYAALALPETNESEKTAKKQALELVVDIYSVIDYSIFIDALCITDNTGKNQLLVTYDGVKWIMSAYDLDTAFGMHWSGAKYWSANYAVSSNNLLSVVQRLYPTELNARKTELKSDVLSRQTILQTLLNFAIDIPQEAYRAEAELWPDQCGANANAMQQITSFVMTRPSLNP